MKTEMAELIERANQMIARLSKEAMNKDSECYSGCVIDVMIKRLYELEHDKNQKDKSKHEFLE